MGGLNCFAGYLGVCVTVFLSMIHIHTDRNLNYHSKNYMLVSFREWICFGLRMTII